MKLMNVEESKKQESSILKKILKRSLFIPIMAILVFSLITFLGISILKGKIVESSANLGETSAKNNMRLLQEQAKANLSTMASNKAAISDEKLGKIQNYVEMIAYKTAEIYDNPNYYNQRAVYRADPKNEGKYVAQLQYAEDFNYNLMKNRVGLIANINSDLHNIIENDSEITKCYVGSKDGFFISVDKDSRSKSDYFDPRERGWYTEAVKNGGVTWSDVIDDQSGRGLAIICSKPIYSKNGELIGVAGIGCLLENLNEIVIGNSIGKNGYGCIVNEEGQVIISPNIRRDKDGNVVRDSILNSQDEALQKIASDMMDRKNGMELANIKGEAYFIAYDPMEVLPWSVAMLMPYEEVVQPAVDGSKAINKSTEKTINEINQARTVLLLCLLGALLIMIVIIIKMAKVSALSIATPILELTEGAKVIGAGDFSHKLEADTGDEIETLANTFNRMIDDIQLITSEKERIGAELDVATNIQGSMLPSIFPAFPERTDIDIYATMLPAKEVGGDFYDFFLIDEKHLGVVMADVSGKGVPAALFMVIAKTLIKNYAQMGMSPADVFARANNQLCEGNEATMFVTAFMGVLELETGEFKYVNAGHNPPCIKKKNGDFEWLATPAGFVLAGMEDINFKENSILFEEGDVIYMYTDGVTEAENNEEDLFSDEKLLVVLNKYKDCTLNEILKKVKEEIDIFAEGAPQFDDITMLALKYIGNGDSSEGLQK